MNAKPVAAKLGIRPAQSVFVINPPGDYATLVGGLPPGTTVVRHRPADVVHLFARTLVELAEHGAEATAAVKPGGMVWISYPKGGASELKRDMLHDAITGWQPVTQIAIDETWSALRFRPDAEVGKR
jgi:hypothetical protein